MFSKEGSPRQPSDAVAVEEAQRLLRGMLRPCGWEWVEVSRSSGRVLAQDILSPADLPPREVALKDGYALRMGDILKGRPVRLRDSSQGVCGVGDALGPGEAIRVMTGIPLPEGADAVLPAEEGAVEEDGRLRFLQGVPQGVNVGRRGDVVRKGQTLLRRGERVRPEGVALMAGMGLGKVKVTRRPRVRVLPTGSELVVPGERAGEGRVFASHGWYLRSMVETEGGRAVVEAPVPDDPDALRKAVGQGKGEQITLTTGGTGKGERDLISTVMEEMGAASLFQGIRMSPGRTTALYELAGRPILALPGGLGGVEVGFEILVRPALGFLLSVAQEERRVLECVTQEPLRLEAKEYRFVEARVWTSGGQLLAAPAPRRDRGWGLPVATGDGWIEVPPGQGEIPKGALVRVRCKSNCLG